MSKPSLVYTGFAVPHKLNEQIDYPKGAIIVGMTGQPKDIVRTGLATGYNGDVLTIDRFRRLHVSTSSVITYMYILHTNIHIHTGSHTLNVNQVNPSYF